MSHFCIIRCGRVKANKRIASVGENTCTSFVRKWANFRIVIGTFNDLQTDSCQNNIVSCGVHVSRNSHPWRFQIKETLNWVRGCRKGKPLKYFIKNEKFVTS